MRTNPSFQLPGKPWWVISLRRKACANLVKNMCPAWACRVRTLGRLMLLGWVARVW